MSRPHRLSVATCSGGYRHFLTMCTRNRRPHFSDSAVVCRTIDHFVQTASVEGFEVLAYCFMPDHLHVLVQGLTEGADLRRFVRLAKQRAGFWFARERHERLWQDSFFDRTLRQEDELATVIRYVINNPVRAGLVDAPVAYRHWGSQKFSREEILEFIQEARPRRV